MNTRLWMHLIFFCSSALALECPKYNDPSVPPCPEIPLLSEQYPIAAVAVAGGSKFAGDYLTAVFKAQSRQPPVVLLNADPKEHAELVARLRKEFPGDANRLIAQIKRNDMAPLSWQQDFFGAFADAKTGRPILRPIENYRNKMWKVEQQFPKLKSSIKGVCDLRTGKPLGVGFSTGGVAGGNLAAAGDFCVIGDGALRDMHFDQFALGACGEKKDNVVKVPTGYLRTAHVDEVYKTIPLPGKSPPCNFAIGLASPERAFALLERYPGERLLDRSDMRAMMDTPAYFSLCREFNDFQLKPSGEDGKTRSHARWWRALVRTALAADGEEIGNPKLRELSEAEKAKCAQMTNRDLLSLIRNHADQQQLNNDVQAKMKQFGENFKAKIANKYKGCEPPVLALPQLFWNQRSPDGLKAESIFPNPSNGEFVNGIYLMPDAANGAFARDLAKQFSDLDVGLQTINTDSLHDGTGNLHCATHAIRYCRPRK